MAEKEEKTAPEQAEVALEQDTAVAAPAAAYAVFKVGEHEHKVSVGDRVEIEWDLTTLEGEEDAPTELEFDQVLLTKPENGDLTIGTPMISGVSVKAKVVGKKNGDKLTSYKKTRRQGYHKKKGHKQRYLEVEIASIP